MVGAEQPGERLELGAAAVEVGTHRDKDDRPTRCGRVRQGGDEGSPLSGIGGRGENLLELVHDDEDLGVIRQHGGGCRERVGGMRQPSAVRLVEGCEDHPIELPESVPRRDGGGHAATGRCRAERPTRGPA